MESFVFWGMLKGFMAEEEIRMMKEQECIEATVNGRTTEMVSIKKLEERFKNDFGSESATVPNNDIWHHQWKAGFPIHVTLKDVIKDMKKLHREALKPWEKKLLKEDDKLTGVLKALEENRQNTQ